MIYILCKNYIDEGIDIENAILMSSTNINDVLDCAYKDISIDMLNEYNILMLEDGGYGEDSICLTSDAYEHFIKYPSYLFSQEEYAEEYKFICDCLHTWCQNIKTKKRKFKEISMQREEVRERELYEKLKAKYGN